MGEKHGRGFKKIDDLPIYHGPNAGKYERKTTFFNPLLGEYSEYITLSRRRNPVKIPASKLESKLLSV